MYSSDMIKWAIHNRANSQDDGAKTRYDGDRKNV